MRSSAIDVGMEEYTLASRLSPSGENPPLTQGTSLSVSRTRGQKLFLQKRGYRRVWNKPPVIIEAVGAIGDSFKPKLLHALSFGQQALNSHD